jgi:hypothetical protein
MQNIRTITIGYTEYILPEDATRKDISDLMSALLSLRPVDSRGREIAGKWISIEHLSNMRVALGSRTLKDLFENEGQATRHLDYLEQQAAQPETVGDPF